MTTRLHFSLLFFFKGKSQDWRNVFWKYADAFCYCPLSVIFKPVNPIERGKATYASQRMPTIHSTNFTTGTAVFLSLWTAMHAKQQYRHLPSLLYTFRCVSTLLPASDDSSGLSWLSFRCPMSARPSSLWATARATELKRKGVNS